MALAAPSVADAAVQVNTTADQNDASCPVDCSLREAVVEAMRTGDIVNVPAGSYMLSLGQLNVGGNVTIQGAGAGATVIRAGSNARVIQVTSSATIAGVTITGGDAPTNSGGGIEVGTNQVALTLRLNDSAVSGNLASGTQGYGGGIMVNGLATLVMTSSTVSGNRVVGEDGEGVGGGIYVDAGGRAELHNSTASGNIADVASSPGVGGGIGLNPSSTLVMDNVTVASNTSEGGGLATHSASTPPAITMSNSIIAGNSATACSGLISHAGGYNIADDATCGLAATGDRPSTNPLLGPLQVNTGVGRTATHALQPGSPAINAGNPATCKATDQRAAARPAGACDIGAFEYVVPTLRVVTQVANDQGGTRDPADFSVHVRAGADVGGSPQPGSATGTPYTLPVGAYAVSADPLAGYSMTMSGDCAPAGAVTLGENEAKTCTIVASDPPPVAGKTVNVRPKSGTVRIKLPGKKRFRVLREGEQIPLGTTIDTLKGRVTLVAAADKQGKTATSDFYGGIFKVLQTNSAKPITRLLLTEKLSCSNKGKKASIAAKKKKKRKLWGDGKGKFRTEGDYSSATVRGTKWLVEDRCASTLTRVVRGKVAVRDFVKKKTVIVGKGKRYIARAAG